MKFFQLVLLALAIVFVSACNKFGGGFKQSEDKTFEYNHHVSKGGKPATEGDMVKFHFRLRNGDSTIISSYQQGGQPVKVSITEQEAKSLMFKPLLLMSEGDSLTARMSFDSVADQMSMFAGKFKKGDFVEIDLKMIRLVKKADIENRFKTLQDRVTADTSNVKARAIEVEKMLAQKIVEFKAGTLTGVQESPSGLKYLILEPGNGETIKAGAFMAMHYCGELQANGNKFDSSFDRGQPLQYEFGRDRMIPGWDEGTTFLRPGAKAILFIPFDLAYGEREAGNGQIPAKSDLAFYMECFDAIDF